MKNQSKKIAIVADWLIDFGGAELVISHLLEMYPEADIYTSVCFMEHPMLEGRRVYTSWLQKVPILNRKHKLAGILRPWAFHSFDLSGYDTVICSSSAESKQVALGKWNYSSHPEERRILYRKAESLDFSRAQNDGRKKPITNPPTHQPTILVYCHTPIRYYWSHAKEYEDMMEFGLLNPLVKGVFRLVKGWMQRVDYQAAQRVDYFIANSYTTQERIKRYYNRESEVIHPGIETPRSEENGDRTISTKDTSYPLPPAYYLGLGRCIPYKRFDLLVETFNKNGKKLILVTNTDTSLFRTLRKKSDENIEWRFGISNEEKNFLMKNAKAFLFPPEEDFGLVPLEAMVMGTPVIAYRKGGATETVVDGETGIFFDSQTSESLDEGIERFEKMEWDGKKITEHANQFSKENFQEKIRIFIQQHA